MNKAVVCDAASVERFAEDLESGMPRSEALAAFDRRSEATLEALFGAGDPYFAFRDHPMTHPESGRTPPAEARGRGAGPSRLPDEARLGPEDGGWPRAGSADAPGAPADPGLHLLPDAVQVPPAHRAGRARGAVRDSRCAT